MVLCWSDFSLVVSFFIVGIFLLGCVCVVAVVFIVSLNWTGFLVTLLKVLLFAVSSTFDSSNYCCILIILILQTPLSLSLLFFLTLDQ